MSSKQLPLSKSQSCKRPLKAPVKARMLSQCTDIARMALEPPELKSRTSSPSRMSHNLMPPSLEPDSACVTFGSRAPIARCIEAPLDGTPCSSKVVSLGNVSPHHSKCCEATGTPDNFARRSFTSMTFSSIRAPIEATFRPRMLRTTTCTWPSGKLQTSDSARGAGDEVGAVDTRLVDIFKGLSVMASLRGSNCAAWRKRAAIKVYGSSGRSRNNSSKRACMNSWSLCWSK
mmetsp:Transcript_10513/g.30017  ORF Transcript_10513/g.30017 Transcript_10513/m.30017 type:complete len:231 (+) Transcript_10513:872-1564(+)